MQKFNSAGQYVNSATVTREDETGLLTPANWEQEGLNNLWPLQQLAGNRSGTKSARDQRDQIAKAMLNDGIAPWQFSHAFRSS